MRVLALVFLYSVMGIPVFTSPAFAAPPLSPTELKYRLREYFNDRIAFCGPHVGVMSKDPALRFPQFQAIMKNKEEFETILKRKNISLVGPWPDRDKQIVIQEHTILSAIILEPFDGNYKFRLRVPNGADGSAPERSMEDKTPQLPVNAFAIEGTIDPRGKIKIFKKEPVFHTCPN